MSSGGLHKKRSNQQGRRKIPSFLEHSSPLNPWIPQAPGAEECGSPPPPPREEIRFPRVARPPRARPRVPTRRAIKLAWGLFNSVGAMQSRQNLLYCNQNVFSNGLLGAHSRHRQHAVSANQTEPGRRCSIGRLIRWRGELRARKAGHGVLKPLRILPVAVPFGSHLLQRVAALAGSSPIEHARVGRITTPAQRQPRATRLALVADSENRLVRIPPGSRATREQFIRRRRCRPYSPDGRPHGSRSV